MSNLLVKFTMLNTKFLVNTYTALTLPFYYVYQRPWQKVHALKSFQVQTIKDKHGRTIYFRNSTRQSEHQYFKYKTYSDILKTLDRNRQVVGLREVINEKLQYGSDGKPVIVDDKELVKVELSRDYKWLTVGEILDRADAIARGLKQLGINQNDKVMIYSENSLEWFLIALALNRLCAITTTLFSTLGDLGVLYGLNQSEARYLVVGESFLKKIDKLKDKIKFIEKIVYIPNHSASYKNQDPQVDLAKEQVAKKYLIFSLDQILENGRKIEPYEFPHAKPEDNALIMYTSGTTGDPKGVILTNENIYQAIMCMIKMNQESTFKILESTFPAFLPMAHLFGYVTNLTFFVTEGRIAFSSPMTLFSTSPAHVYGQPGDINLIQPELFFTVPLLLEKLIKDIYRKLNASSPIAAPIFTYLMDYKIRWTLRGYDTPIINQLVCKKINQIFGGRLKNIVVGSAPIHEYTHALAKAALNLNCLYNGYGTTEVTGASTIMKESDLSFSRVGVPFDSVKYYLDDWLDGGYTTQDKPNPRGEIIIGGPLVAKGYYKMPEQTIKDFYTDEEGCRWFRTGDIGEVYPDGTLKIIDRKKDLTKLLNGEFISLGKVESGLRSSRYVENICVCTDPYRNEIIALIVPNKRALNVLASELDKQDLSFEKMCDDLLIIEKVYESIENKCHELGFKKREIPAKIVLVKEEWTQDNNMLTAAFKLRRKTVYTYYKDKIKSVYNSI